MPRSYLRPSPEGAHGHHRVTNIELFFDLVFVIAKKQLAFFAMPAEVNDVGLFHRNVALEFVSPNFRDKVELGVAVANSPLENLHDFFSVRRLLQVLVSKPDLQKDKVHALLTAP